jgi:hypothetical protein
MGYEVSLRHSEADHIEVVSIDEAKNDAKLSKAEEEDRQQVIDSKVIDSNDSDEQALGDKMLVAERKDNASNEALAEQDYSKNQDDALEALNEVRERVNLPKRTTEEAPDKDSFMKLLRKERICELAFEGFRYWDLRRWRLAGEVIDGKQAHGTKITKKDDNTYTYEQVSCDDNINRFFPERYYLLPIPVDELQNNPLCENNAPW